ncbi:MAG: ABC transporter ATP-binding protein [Rhodobacteraceae bacterium]|nr:ABC transporter ATP-binding protein [Paracoccaceae bacterium]
MNDLLSVEELKTHFFTRAGVLHAVDGVSFRIAAGEVVGLVGESGSGKSVTGFSIMGLVEPPGRIVSGRIMFGGEDLVTMPQERMRALRGARIAMIFQDPMMTLNPVLTIGTQMIETVLAHAPVGREEARRRARDALGLVGIPSPEERLDAYPHQFSGGMRQRVVIAIAMLHEPDLVIADEPTTALDVTIQAQILAQVQRLNRERGTAVLWVTHDLSVVAGLAHRLCVMYAGRIVEQGPVDDILDDPRHPYTRGLIGSVPGQNRPGTRLNQIPGMMPSMFDPVDGCSFAPRCTRRIEACDRMPGMHQASAGREVRCFNPHPAMAAPVPGGQEETR